MEGEKGEDEVKRSEGKGCVVNSSEMFFPKRRFVGAGNHSYKW